MLFNGTTEFMISKKLLNCLERDGFVSEKLLQSLKKLRRKSKRKKRKRKRRRKKNLRKRKNLKRKKNQKKRKRKKKKIMKMRMFLLKRRRSTQWTYFQNLHSTLMTGRDNFSMLLT